MKNRVKNDLVLIVSMIFCLKAQAAESYVYFSKEADGERVRCVMVEQPNRKNFNIRRCSGGLGGVAEGDVLRFTTEPGGLVDCKILSMDMVLSHQSSGQKKGGHEDLLCGR